MVILIQIAGCEAMNEEQPTHWETWNSFKVLAEAIDIIHRLFRK